MMMMLDLCMFVCVQDAGVVFGIFFWHLPRTRNHRAASMRFHLQAHLHSGLCCVCFFFWIYVSPIFVGICTYMLKITHKVYRFFFVCVFVFVCVYAIDIGSRLIGLNMYLNIEFNCLWLGFLRSFLVRMRNLRIHTIESNCQRLPHVLRIFQFKRMREKRKIFAVCVALWS